MTLSAVVAVDITFRTSIAMNLALQSEVDLSLKLQQITVKTGSFVLTRLLLKND